MSNNKTTPSELTEVAATSLGNLIAAVGKGLADAQRQLDQSAIATFREIQTATSGEARVLRELGYQPTWYRIPKLDAELAVTLSINGDETQTGGGAGDGQPRLYATPVDATYRNKYEFSFELTSKVSFSIVPVPASPQAEQLRLLPKLTGLTETELKAKLAELGLRYRVDGQAPGSDSRVDAVHFFDPARGSDPAKAAIGDVVTPTTLLLVKFTAGAGNK